MDDQTAGANSSNTPSIENFNDPRSIDLKELMKQDDHTNNEFPSIHFTSGDVADDSDEEDDEPSSLQPIDRFKNGQASNVFAPPMITRTLYIQMVRRSIYFIRAIPTGCTGIRRTTNAERGEVEGWIWDMTA